MANQPEPPPPEWDLFSGSATEFDDAQSNAVNNGYGSTAVAIKNAAADPCYLYVGVSQTTDGHITWYFRNPADVTTAAISGKIPQATFNVIAGGTLEKSSGKITYGGNQYQLLLALGANGVVIVEAAAV